MTAKKVAITTGVVLIWGAGLVLAWKAGGLVGDGVSKLCTKATEKLLAL